jgi:two-component system LytT family sensor kinase
VPDIHEPLLVNIIGHTAGAVIFGIFLILFIRDRAGSGFLRGSWLSFAAAALAFLWDAVSLTALSVSHSAPGFSLVAVAVSFAMLSLLPAVLLHLSLKQQLRGVVAAGYVLSSVAVVLHLLDLTGGHGKYKGMALVLIPVGFGILTSIAVVVLALGRKPGMRGYTSRIAGAMCLFLFAISFVHFGSAAANDRWSTELAIHHAGIPLALFVLLQDYRFVLLDAFIRFLANVLLAGLLTWAAVRAGFRLILVETHIERDPLQQALLLVAICVLLIGFALLRNRVQKLLTKVVFRRPDLEKALEAVRSRPAGSGGEAEYIDGAAQQMGGLLRAARTEVMTENQVPADLRASGPLFPMLMAENATLRNNPALRWADAVVPLRFAQGDARYVLLGRRQGGRRYLSEDLELLSRLASAIAEQVERLRSSEVQRLVSQAELRALQSQINPHFLFNALNTLYGTIPREAAGARRTVLNLADIFRYFLQSEKTFIPLGEELQIVRAYLEIEALRLGPRMRTELDIDDAALAFPIPILSIQPLVENAVKHGIAANPAPGWLRLRIRALTDALEISVEDSGGGSGGGVQPRNNTGAGVGLANVTRRLELCYGAEAAVHFRSGPEGSKVQFRIPRARLAQAS